MCLPQPQARPIELGTPMAGTTAMTTDRTLDQQIGRRLRHFRQSLGDRQADFAARVGKERSTIAKYERGERRLTLSDMLDMAERLHYPPAALLLKLLPDFPQQTALDMVLRALDRKS